MEGRGTEVVVGRWYFRHLAEEQRREYEGRNPRWTVEVREVLYPQTQSTRPTYVVILVVEGEGGA